MEMEMERKLSDPSPFNNILNNIQFLLAVVGLYKAFLSLSWNGDEEMNQKEAISFKKVGSSYIVSAPVNLSNYSVNFFILLTCKSFFKGKMKRSSILALGMQC